MRVKVKSKKNGQVMRMSKATAQSIARRGNIEILGDDEPKGKPAKAAPKPAEKPGS
jgi:hypothetical protein